jgi:glycosyltransferase involved in cell wall biosynthesis
MKVGIVIPAYNEAKTIGGIVSRAKKYGAVVVVNDASRDNTAAVAKKAGAVVVTHPQNRGLGAALRTGFDAALKRGFDIIVTIDADGQHKPEEIPKLISKVGEGYDFVLGSRDLLHYPFIKKLGNFFLNLFTNLIAGTNLKDTESGFRAFKKDALKKFYLRAERYEIAVEIIFEVGRNHLRYANVEIESPLYRKGVSFWDGIYNFRYLLRRRKRSMRDYVTDFRFVAKNAARSFVAKLG